MNMHNMESSSHATMGFVRTSQVRFVMSHLKAGQWPLESRLTASEWPCDDLAESLFPGNVWWVHPDEWSGWTSWVGRERNRHPDGGREDESSCRQDTAQGEKSAVWWCKVQSNLSSTLAYVIGIIFTKIDKCENYYNLGLKNYQNEWKWMLAVTRERESNMTTHL